MAWDLVSVSPRCSQRANGQKSGDKQRDRNGPAREGDLANQKQRERKYSQPSQQRKTPTLNGMESGRKVIRYQGAAAQAGDRESAQSKDAVERDPDHELVDAQFAQEMLSCGGPHDAEHKEKKQDGNHPNFGDYWNPCELPANRTSFMFHELDLPAERLRPEPPANSGGTLHKIAPEPLLRVEIFHGGSEPDGYLHHQTAHA